MQTQRLISNVRRKAPTETNIEATIAARDKPGDVLSATASATANRGVYNSSRMTHALGPAYIYRRPRPQ